VYFKIHAKKDHKHKFLTIYEFLSEVDTIPREEKAILVLYTFKSMVQSEVLVRPSGMHQRTQFLLE
jgi:hypothetical protein